MVYGHDLWAVFAYTTRRVATELAAGRLPAWEPHVLAGYPLLASMQAAVLYPPAWGAALLSDATFWNVVLAAHLVLAALFADLWLRRGLGLDRRAALAGAVVFALAGFPWMRIFAGHVHYVWAYPWAAAVLWRLERWLAGPSLRRAVLLGSTLVPMVLAGVPQLALATALAVAVRLAHFVLAGGRGGRTERAKVAAGAAAALAVGSLLAAPQVLPALELAAESQRGSVADSRFVTSFSLPPGNLITLIAPRFFGDGNEAPYWGRWNAWEVCGDVASRLSCSASSGSPARTGSAGCGPRPRSARCSSRSAATRRSSLRSRRSCLARPNFAARGATSTSSFSFSPRCRSPRSERSAWSRRRASAAHATPPAGPVSRACFSRWRSVRPRSGSGSRRAAMRPGDVRS